MKDYFKKRSPKPLKRKKTDKELATRSRQKFDNVSDLKIKENWKTIMKFNAHKWDPKHAKPACVKNIDPDIDKNHFVGRSDVERVPIYFLVSENIIPDDPPQYIFNAKFLEDMEINKEMEIPQDSKDRLIRTVRLFQGKCIVKIYPQKTVDGVKTFHGKQKNGHIDKKIDQEWIDINFKYRFPPFYDSLMDENNVNDEFDTPDGAVDLSDSDSEKEIEDAVPKNLLTKEKVHYRFENKNSCAFGNMANGLFTFNDEKAADFFYFHREDDMDVLRKEHTKIDHKAHINAFHLAREILRQKFKYIVTFVKGIELVDLAKEHKNNVLYVMLQPAESAISHVVCITKNQIIDGTFTHRLKCNEQAIRWLCNDSDYSFHGYKIEMSPKVKKALQKNK